MEKTFHMLIYRLFHAQRNYLRPYLNEIGLGPGQPKILSYLAKKGSCQQRELADYFEIDPAAVSRMLDALDKSGFITRRADQTNRRSDIIEVTEKGKQADRIWRDHCKEMEHVMLQSFNREEQQQFSEYLSRAYQNFKQKKL